MAVLKSREYTGAFISEIKQLPVLFASDWDAKAGIWKSRYPAQWPDVRDAEKYFDKEVNCQVG